MNGSINIGVAQTSLALGAPAERLAWLERILPGLARKGLDLLLLPELFMCGYRPDTAMAELAENKDGPFGQAVSKLAKEHALAIVYGYPEADGGRIFNAAQCFGPDGERLANHRKIFIPAGFERDTFAPGTSTTIFSYKGARIGLLICYDAEMPVLPAKLAREGADVVLVPMALATTGEGGAESMIPKRGAENKMYLACANHVGRDMGITFHGGSQIIAADGVPLAGAGHKVGVCSAVVGRKERVPAE